MKGLMVNKQKGFSLVEIAVVLVILGLLLGGILKGQEMIRQAKIQDQIQQISRLISGINTYIRLHGYATFTRIPNSADRWKALSDGGYISGYTGGDFLKNKYGGITYIFTLGASSFTTISICTVLEKEYADEIDRKVDNGSPASGNFRAVNTTNPYSTTNALCFSVGQ